MSSRPFHAATAALGLALLVGSLATPLLEAALAKEPAPSCCGRGHCRCRSDATNPGDRPCLRQRCGCGGPDEAVIAPPVSIEAVLPPSRSIAPPVAVVAAWLVPSGQPLSRTAEPPVPPPRRSLPA
jgi:hypothetical protein